MATTIVEDDRIHLRRQRDDEHGDVVVYWMQAAQRSRHNEALEYAIQQANERSVPLAVVFCLVAEYPDATTRHYRFLIQGLVDVRRALRRRSIDLTVFAAPPHEVLAAIDHRCRLIVFDRGYLPIQRRWRDEVFEATTASIHEVETEVVVPVDLVTDKAETAARTIRPKIHEHLDTFVVSRRTTALDRPSLENGRAVVDLARTATDVNTLPINTVSINTVSIKTVSIKTVSINTVSMDDVDDSELDAMLTELGFDPQDRVSPPWPGGEHEAQTRLRRFCPDVLPDYDSRRNRFDLDASCSMLSPHLHFGQISPVLVAAKARASSADEEQIEAFIEELVVRRELAANFVHHVDDHDRFAGLPEWARTTLRDHADDPRPGVYTASELEAGQTDDDVWNAIMATIRERGWVHNQLRMYWGKQILQWTNTPEHAYRTLLELNNRYFLDGRDPNSYANVGWCFGLHDQGFEERDIIGKVRPFTDQALRRKGDLDGWLDA